MAETKINANQTNITASDIGGLTNNTSNSGSLSINGTISGTGSYNTAIQGSITSSNAEKSVVIGCNAVVYSHYSIALGAQAYANYYAIAIGRSSQADGTNAIAIGVEAEATAANAIQLGAGSREVRRNTDANTFKVGNANGNFEIMSADGTIPMARIPYVLKTITSSSASGYAANTIVQYVGTTDATCTNGYFYKAGIIPSSATISQTTGSGLTDIAVVVSTFETKISTTGNYNFTYIEDALAWVNPDNYFITLADYGISYTGTPADGDVLTVVYVGESNSWTQVNVQPAGSSLPSQSGNAGKFLTTNGTDASWGTTVDENVLDIKNTASGLYSDQLQMRLYAPYNNTDGTPVEIYANHSGICTISGVSLSLGSIRTTSTGKDIGSLGYPFRRIYVSKLNNGADIEVPNVAGEIAVKQVNTTVTLTAAGWSSNTQTVNVTGMTATGVVLVSPDPTDQSDYTSAGILCTAQAAGTLTFTCDTVPSGDIDVNVVML